MGDLKVTKHGQKDYQQFIDRDELIGESALNLSDYFNDDNLSMSDYYHSSIPYDVKPVPYLRPMEEGDYPIQAKDLFSGLFQETPKSQLRMAPLINETDVVYWNDNRYHWSEDGMAVIIISDKRNYLASVIKNGNRVGIYSNIPKFEKAANNEYSKKDVIYINTHLDVEDVLWNLCNESDVRFGELRLKGRIFYLGKGEYIFGFWEKRSAIRKYKDVIFDFLRRIKLSPEKILWTSSGGLDKVITYNEMFRSAKKDGPRHSKEQVEMLRKIHLDDVLKRKVLQLPPHPFQLLADKLGVSVAQLRQIAGMSVAEEIKIPTMDERIQLCESMQRGAGFWLDTKGNFHDVDKKPFSGHVSYAKHHLKDPNASYPEMFAKGFIWVGVFNDFVGFNYGMPPTALQMYLLKKESEDIHLKLYDLVKKEYVDTSLLKETEEFQYGGKIYSFSTHALSTMVLFESQKRENIQIESGDATIIVPPIFYLGTNDETNDWISDWKELENYVNEYGRYSDEWWKSHGQVKNEAYEFIRYLRDTQSVDASADMLLEARVFKDEKFPGGYAIGFWQGRDVVRKYRDKILEFLKQLGINNPTEILWTADGGSVIQTYAQFWDQPNPHEDPEKTALLKLVHLNAVAKKQLLAKPINKLQRLADSMGITLVQLRQLLGSMDEVEGAKDSYGREVSWIYAQAIFTIFPNNLWCLQKWDGDDTLEYECSDPELEKVLNENPAYQLWPGDKHRGNSYARVHGSLAHNIDLAYAQIGKKTDFNSHYHGQIASRIFKMDGTPPKKTVVGFWQSLEEVRSHWPTIEKILKLAEVDYENARYTVNNKYSVNREYSYKDVTGKDPAKFSVSPEELKLMKLQHLSPEAKKALLHVPSNRLENLADSMGITLPQLRQMLGSMDEAMNPSLNATLIWLEKDGTIHDTEEVQHGLYVADHPSLFGVSNALVNKVFKNANTNERFDFDDAAAIMCEKAFQNRWMRVVKIPWRNKIMVEGQEPTKEQRRVLEDWFFEDKDIDIIWQQWVSSKFGPPRPVTLFTSKNVLEGKM